MLVNKVDFEAVSLSRRAYRKFLDLGLDPGSKNLQMGNSKICPFPFFMRE